MTPLLPTDLRFVVAQIHFDQLRRPFNPQDTLRLCSIAGASEKCPHADVVSAVHTSETTMDVTFATRDRAATFEWLKLFLRELKVLKGSIIVAQGDRGWDDYLLLHHFDRNEKLDSLEQE